MHTDPIYRMTHSSCILVTAVLLLLSVIAVAQSQLWQCNSENCRRYELRELFEEALVSSSDALWQLQQIYFDPSSDQGPALVNLSVWITVNDVNESDTLFFGCDHAAFQYDCSNGSAYSSHCKNGQWAFVSNYQLLHPSSDSSHIARLMTTSLSTTVFYILDPSFYTIMKTLSSSIKLFLPDAYYGVSKTIKMHINTTLQENVCWDDATSALKMVLMWAKAYARANGIPLEKQDKDRSTVRSWSLLCSENQVTGYNEGPLTDTCYTPVPFIGIFALANLLVLTLTSLNFRKIFLWLKRQGKQAKILYKASATVLTFINIITLITDIVIGIRTVYMSNKSELYGDFSLIMVVKAPIVFLILISELVVACSSTHLPNETNRRCTCQRFAHAFAFCQIIWFVHRLVNDVIISVVFFIIAPAQTLGIDALLLAVIGSAIAFLAFIIHKGSDGCNKTLCSFSICIALNGLIIFGLLLAITWVFIVLINNGLKSAGMGGLILSLIPPVIVTIVGYIVKEKYFKSTSSESVSEQLLQEVNETTTIQNIDDEDQDTEETTPLLQSER